MAANEPRRGSKKIPLRKKCLALVVISKQRSLVFGILTMETRTPKIHPPAQRRPKSAFDSKVQEGSSKRLGTLENAGSLSCPRCGAASPSIVLDLVEVGSGTNRGSERLGTLADGDSRYCQECGVAMPERSVIHGSARRFCSAKCRRRAWGKRNDQSRRDGPGRGSSGSRY